MADDDMGNTSDKKKLEKIKKIIEQSYQYFEANYDRFYEFKKFVFATSLSESDRSTLNTLGKPDIEFNTLEAYISRLLGEFATQEPSVSVRAADGMSIAEMTPEYLATMDLIEAHARHILSNISTDNLEYDIYRDQLAGGFSVMRVYTDYIHSESFEQGIYIDRVFDPTLCGFDPLARTSHKGDGRFCFELSPYTKDAFEEEFGKDKLNGVKFARKDNITSFNWSYKSENEDIILVGDYYVKKKKRTKIVRLANGEIGTMRAYNKALKDWEENPTSIAVPPAIIDERTTIIETIELYRITENQILDHYETDYVYLPLVFVDGNSIMLRESGKGSSVQMTRPYVYQAMGIQRLRNFAGQTIAQQIENMVQHKIKVPIEGIPEKYKEAYEDVQSAQTLVYNQYWEGDINARLDPPTEIIQTPPPPIVESTFMGADRVTQSILGNYDQILGIGQKDISGKAIQQGAIQSSIASDPYLVNFIKALNRVLQIIVDLIPKYYKTPRSIPVIAKNGKPDYQLVNDPMQDGSIPMSYDPKQMQIKVEAGVNSQVEKQASLEMLTKMMQASQTFAEFINVRGLPTILDNLDIRGIDNLKAQSEQFLQDREKQQAEAAQQPGEAEIIAQAEMHKAEMEHDSRMQSTQVDLLLGTAKNAVEEEKVEVKKMEVALKAQEANAKIDLQADKQASDAAHQSIGLAIDLAKDIT